MSARKLTRDGDRQLWVETRLVHASRPWVTLARRRALEVAYERLNPTDHQQPVNVRRYGTRLGERAQALYAR